MTSNYLIIVSIIVSLFLENGHCDSQVSILDNKVDPGLLFSLEKGDTANILLQMQESTNLVLKNLKQREFASRTVRLNTVTNELKTQAEISQKPVIEFLSKSSVGYKSFWISNQIYIPGADLTLVQKLSELPDVSKISREVIIQLEEPSKFDSDIEPLASIENIQWGVQKIQADAVWDRKVTGEGVVVGVMDTGARRTHRDLQSNFRQEYGWYDAVNNLATPYDDQGHGTHCTGTIVGANGIGIAPGAQWIHCKAGDASGSFNGSNLLECGQFLLCPHLPNGAFPDCSMAPHLVSNSWGGTGGRNFYNEVTDAWIAAGIIPFFAIGNSGPECGTAGSPGDQNVIAVGATTLNDSLAAFSSRGAGWTDGDFKPDISAPGQNIVSASPFNDTLLVIKSGTSMACPHAAGLGALLMSIKKDLSYEEMKMILFSTVDTDELNPPSTYCGSQVGSLYPNNAFGYGRINAYKAVLALSGGNLLSTNLLVVGGALAVVLIRSFPSSFK